MILAGLAPTDYYNANVVQSFTSSKTPSHNSPAGSFSVIEGLPHNNVHNCIGGVGPVDPGPYGNMTNFLSTVDPIFFLHHANIDRLWDVWTRKQQGFGLPILPSGADLKTLSDEPFLFYVDGKGNPVGPNSKAGDYLSTDVFQYDYEPGSGEEVVPIPPSRRGRRRQGPRAARAATVRGTPRRSRCRAPPCRPSRRHPPAPAAGVDHPAPPRRAFHHARLRRAGQRAGRRSRRAGSPYYAGTVAFFGPMMPGMHMPMDTTFAVPLPKAPPSFTAMAAAPNATLTSAWCRHAASRAPRRR